MPDRNDLCAVVGADVPATDRDPLPFRRSAPCCAYSVHVNAGQWATAAPARPSPAYGPTPGLASGGGHSPAPLTRTGSTALRGATSALSTTPPARS